MERSTFTNYEALLRKAADLCAVDAVQLRNQADETNERYTLALNTIADQQVQLSNTLSRYADHAPKDFLQTRLQFTPEGIASGETESSSPGEALQRLEQHNERLNQVFGQCAEAATSDEMSEQLSNVRGLLEAHARKVAGTLDQAKDT